MVTVLIKRDRVFPRSGFTLIEVLVVVAIIALLVAILIPSLQRAREQAKRTTCATNLHQCALGFNTYNVDHKGKLPYRGWFPYTFAETPHECLGVGGNGIKMLCNLGLLRGGLSRGVVPRTFRSWLGKDWDVIWCPNMYWIRDGQTGIKYYAVPPTNKSAGGHIFSHGGYEYAAPIRHRFRRQMPGESSRDYKIASQANPGSSPNLGKNNVYPRYYIEEGYWELLQMKQGLTPIGCDKGPAPRLPKGCQALVADWQIGMDPKKAHNNGFNALYSDGHVKFFQTVILPGVGRASQFETWYYYNTHR